MNTKSIPSRKKMGLILALVLLTLAGIVLLIVNGYSKYRTQLMISNEVDYTNQLAASFKLMDEPVKQQLDGSYALDTDVSAKPTQGGNYRMIPGITIPAAPYVEIIGKTEIPAYLYLEIVNPEHIQILIDSEKWTLLDGVTGKNNGQIYVYQSVLSGEEGKTDLKIPTFTFTQLDKIPAAAGGEIHAYAYMIQTNENQTAAQVFAAAVTNVAP